MARHTFNFKNYWSKNSSKKSRNIIEKIKNHTHIPVEQQPQPWRHTLACWEQLFLVRDLSPCNHSELDRAVYGTDEDCGNQLLRVLLVWGCMAEEHLHRLLGPAILQPVEPLRGTCLPHQWKGMKWDLMKCPHISAAAAAWKPLQHQKVSEPENVKENITISVQCCLEKWDEHRQNILTLASWSTFISSRDGYNILFDFFLFFEPLDFMSPLSSGFGTDLNVMSPLFWNKTDLK